MKIAVYGSLKQGFHNNCVLLDAPLVGVGTTMPEFTMVDLGSFPGVVHEGDTEVIVEVYEVEDMANLDALEGNGSFYTREIQPILMSDGWVDVWIYLLPTSYLNNELVESGEWEGYEHV